MHSVLYACEQACIHTHSAKHMNRPQTTLQFGRGEWGVVMIPVTPHMLTHTIDQSLPSDSRPVLLKHSASPLLVFLCYYYGFLCWSWGLYCFLTVHPVYSVTACCSLCPLSCPKLLLLPAFRFASWVTWYLLYTMIKCCVLPFKFVFVSTYDVALLWRKSEVDFTISAPHLIEGKAILNV